MSDANKSIFVIGDLVIDHAIFVRSEAERMHQEIEGEPTYEVLRRQTVAGGAANSARLLSVLNDGPTFLWGITGKSEYGTFRDILDHSHLLDGTSYSTELLGIDAETDAPMHCISRIISIYGKPPNYDRRAHKVRFDEYREFYIPDVKRQFLLIDLIRTSSRCGVNAIIFNDLDLEFLTRQLVNDVCKFAKNKNIAVFVDPKRDITKYTDIEATAILPNLYEWCHLVGEEKRLGYWRKLISSNSNLEEMAEISLYNLPNFKFHIIKCDSEGAIIIAPDQQDQNSVNIFRMNPIPSSNPHYQLGCGDVMVAALALFCPNSQVTSDEFLQAAAKSNIIVGCYREQLWQRMPSKQSVKLCMESLQPMDFVMKVASLPNGFRLLPKEKKISLQSACTSIQGLISVSEEFKSSIARFVTDIKANPIPHFLIAAPPGSGKSSILKYLQKIAASLKVGIEDRSGKLSSFGDKPLDKLRELSKKFPAAENGIIVFADEAIKSTKELKYLKTIGPILLDSALNCKIAFVIADAKLYPQPEEKVGQEVNTRCKQIIIPTLAKRSMDIPYIFISSIMHFAGVSNLTIEGRTLLNCINHVLAEHEPSPRTLVKLAEDIAEKISDRKTTFVTYGDLPSGLQCQCKYERKFGEYEFNV